jgi:CHAT domain-containing protein
MIGRQRWMSAAVVFALALMLMTVSANGQTEDELIRKIPSNLPPDVIEIHKILIRGYTAYAKNDAPTLLSLFSQKSPYFASFKQLIEEDYATNEKVKIDGLDAKLTRNVELHGDKATARLHVRIHAVNSETGKVADGFGPQDHTLRLVKGDDGWKIWQFRETAAELTENLLAAATAEERLKILNASEPFTDGLLRGLAEQAMSLLERKGDDINAEILFNLLLGLSTRIDSLLGRANALVGLGDVYLSRGDYLRAAANFQTVMRLAEKEGSKEGVAAVSIKLGNVHYYQGDYAQAMEYYQRSADLYEKLGSTQEIAYPYLSIGNAYLVLADFTRALEYYQKSLKIYDSIFDRAGSAYLLNRIGEVYAAQNRLPQALEAYHRSLELQEKFGFKSMKASSLLGIAAVREKENNYTEAARVAANATEVARENNYPEILWRTLTAQGRAFRALKQSQKAEQSLTEAVEILERMRSYLVGDEREQQLFFEDKTEPYIALVELAFQKQDPSTAFRYAELARARMLLDVVRKGRADLRTAMTDDERKRHRELNARLSFLNTQIRKEGSQPQPDATRLSKLETTLRTARLEAEAYETQIYAAHPEPGLTRAAKTSTVEELAPTLLDTQTAILEYVVAPKTTYLFVLTKPEAKPRSALVLSVYSISIEATDLSQRVAAFRNQIADNSLAFKEPARQLYDLLVLPAQPQLEGKKRVCIVPAGDLWELPFQALLSKSDKYFLEEHAISFAPSLSVLSEMVKRRVTARLQSELAFPKVSGTQVEANLERPASILALGNPKFDSEAFSKSRSTSLGDLPAAEREVKSLAEIYGVARSKVLIGAAAREQVFKASASQYSVLHLATHGILDDASPMYSRLLLAVDPTGADDGFLEAREVMKLNLPAELVVLSACQTARGQVSNGEGLIGMSWAFLIAGASTTLVSQWKVDSESTSQLMVNFHRHLQRDNFSKAEALRQSALNLMKDPRYRHPFYWSGFVLVGSAN